MIIVTGAAGLIGSALVKHLNDRGREDIIIVDRFKNEGKWRNVRDLKFYEFIHMDQFYEFDLLYELFQEGVDAVYHLGACSSTTETDMDYLHANNVQTSQIIFRICTDFNVPLCYASSAATYGAGEKGYDDDHQMAKSLTPLNKYGYSKKMFDDWALRQTEAPRKWYGIKFFNVYGPNEYHKGKMSSVVYQAYQQILERDEVRLFKSHREDYLDGQQLRDFVYVKDVVAAMVELISTDHNGDNGLYNMGTGKARSFYDLVDATFKALERKTNIEFIDMPENLRSQYQYFTQANMEKLVQALPDFKFHSLEEGVTDYVIHHLVRPSPYLSSHKDL